MSSAVTTVTLLATSGSGVGKRVADTMTGSGESEESGASAAEATALSDEATAHAAARQAAQKRLFFMEIKAPAMTNDPCRHSGNPQPPAHPGRKQDDGARQVSWLPGRCYRSPSRGIASVAHRTIARRLQLRGQPRYQTAFPFKPVKRDLARLKAGAVYRIKHRCKQDPAIPCRAIGEPISIL